MSDLLASKLREEVFTAIRAHTAATVSETEAATLAILRLVENAAPSDDETCTGCYGSGYDSNGEARCHCQPALDAARGETPDERQAAIVAIIREFASKQDCRGCPNMEPNVSLNQVADAIEARAHWKDEQ